VDWSFYTTPPMRAVTGYIAQGRTDHYMVTHSPYGGVVLCRWHIGGVVRLEDARQAAITSAQVSTADEGRRMAELYESGENIPELGPAWCQPGTPALRTNTEG